MAERKSVIAIATCGLILSALLNHQQTTPNILKSVETEKQEWNLFLSGGK